MDQKCSMELEDMYKLMSKLFDLPASDATDECIDLLADMILVKQDRELEI